jgi:FAD/FMN-containing dehydrogenase
MVVTVDPRVSVGVVESNKRPIDELLSRVAGTVITVDSPEYDEARGTLYFTMDRRPLAIVRPADSHDVAETVRFAREHEYPLSVRSGGHSLAHYSVIDGAINIDLSSMKRVEIDPEARIARVQGGARSNDLAGPAGEHGLALTTGDTGSVGLGGLTTGGGIGFMVRKHGLTIDNLLSATVVTANGDILTASPDENPDLFWAIRGGGGNFGIVTEFVYRLAEVPQILGGMIALPASREVLRKYLEYSVSAPEDLTTIANLMYVPPFPGAPEEHVGKLSLAILVSWTGSIEDGELALAPLRALAAPLVDMVGPMPYPEIYRLTDPFSAPHGGAIRSMFAHQLSDAALDATIAAMEKASSPFSLVQFRGLGGAFARVPSDATAFAHRSQSYFVAILGIWLDPSEDGALHAAWTESLWKTIRPEGSGVYVNFLENEGADRIRDAYPPATLARLTETKRTYDPKNLFRFNQNVSPKK